jgi:hypothetical protein
MQAAAPAVFGVPLDFILFALTLLGVALFHHHTLRVAKGTTFSLALVTCGSMTWFGSSAGVALSNMYPQAKNVDDSPPQRDTSWNRCNG